MNPRSPEPTLAQDLIRIHKVITRAIYTGLINGTEYSQSGVTDMPAIQGYSRYVHCLAEVLRSHHTSEDEIAFPAFMKVIPSAPYGQLTADHHMVDTLLAPIPQAIADLSGNSLESGLKVIVDTFRRLSDIWETHMLLEEHFFSKDALNSALTPEEQKIISDATAKHNQENSSPSSWVIPFVLYNLEPEERAIMIGFLPPVIMEQLVPIAWKDEWAPMKPFLLN